MANQNGGLLRNAIEFVGIILFALVLAWLISTFVVQPFQIPTGSMEPTIEINDRILAEKVSYYFRDIEQNDIVTFSDPSQAGRTLIKRVIAVGGQTVDLQDGQVVIDGVPYNESYTYGLPSEPLPSQLDGVTISYPYTVPEGSIWVMGDNRINSADSRYFGPISVEEVTGRAFCTYWPLTSIGGLS